MECTLRDLALLHMYYMEWTLIHFYYGININFTELALIHIHYGMDVEGMNINSFVPWSED